MIIRKLNRLTLPFLAAICVGCGGGSDNPLEDTTDFGDDSASGQVGDCVASTGTEADLVGTWDLAAIEGVSEDTPINGPLTFYSTGTYDFTFQIDTPDYFANYTNETGSYSYTESESVLATNGAFSTIFSPEFEIQFCNDNTQFTYTDDATDGRRYTYVKQ